MIIVVMVVVMIAALEVLYARAVEERERREHRQHEDKLAKSQNEAVGAYLVGPADCNHDNRNHV